MFSKRRHVLRLYTESITDEFIISNTQNKHLLNVLRLTVGSKFIAFNPNEGEWICEICSVSNKQVVAKRITCTRTYYPSQKLYIAFGIIKPDKMRFIIEKCTELGTTEFFPLITEYTQFRNINISKLKRIATQASEQSERIDVPVIHEPIKLLNLIESLSHNVVWLSAIEHLDCVNYKHQINNNVGFIVGPEGGFSDSERSLLASRTVPISLGCNILRAETACIACACLATYFKTF